MAIDLDRYKENLQQVEHLFIKKESVIVKEIKENFKVDTPICVHWDGKLLRDMTDENSKMVDRLPVIVSGTMGDTLLGVPKLDSGTGLNQAKAVYSLLQKTGNLAIKSVLFALTPLHLIQVFILKITMIIFIIN